MRLLRKSAFSEQNQQFQHRECSNLHANTIQTLQIRLFNKHTPEETSATKPSLFYQFVKPKTTAETPSKKYREPKIQIKTSLLSQVETHKVSDGKKCQRPQTLEISSSSRMINPVILSPFWAKFSQNFFIMVRTSIFCLSSAKFGSVAKR